jgi:photosystem II stability/assembly factor-like uncharacterized protein
MTDIVYGLAPSPNFAREPVVFAARSSGLFRSDDGGQTWRSVYGSLALTEPLPTTAVAVSPDFGADRTLFAGVSGGILQSTDGGQTWRAARLPPPPPTISCLVISPAFAQDGVLLAGTLEDGVFRSADRGRRWSAWNFGLLDLNVLCLAASPGFAEDETLYAGTNSGVFRSTNGGRAWREVTLSMGFEPVLSLALSPNYVDDGGVFAGTENHGLLYSPDRGAAWRRLGEADLIGVINAVMVSPGPSGQPAVLAALDQAVWLSPDGGQSWSAWGANDGLDHNIVSIAAPQGSGASGLLLVGMADGDIRRGALNHARV